VETVMGTVMATVGVTLPVAVLALGLTASFVASNATRSLEVPVYHDRAHVRAGHLLRETGHVDRAFAEYEEALQIEPRNADALYELGTRAWNDRDLATAEPLLRRFLEAEASGERADQVGAVLRDVDAQRSRK
jgi:Tfp pilus assembly protein PilF